MRMPLDESRHEGSAVRLDDVCSIRSKAFRRTRNRLDPGAIDKHIRWKRGRAAAIPHTCAAKKNRFHSITLHASYVITNLVLIGNIGANARRETG
jgi:hypothetical protein